MDMTAAMELRVKNDQAKAALAATKAEVKDLGAAAKQATTDSTRLGPTLANGAAEASPKVAALKGELLEMNKASFLSGNGARQMGMQLSQVGQQTMATGNFVQALAIQLPDIGLAFGAVGTAAGLLAGIALPMVMSAFGGAKEEGEGLEKQLSALMSALDNYDRFVEQSAKTTVELSEKFGDFAGQIKGFSEYMAGVSLGRSLDELKASIDPLKGGLSGVVEQFERLGAAQSRLTEAYKSNDAERIAAAKEIFDLLHEGVVQSADDLGLTVDQAMRLATALDNLGNAESMIEMRDSAAAALEIMQQMVPAGAQLPGPLRDTAEALSAIVEKTAESTSQMGGFLDVLFDAVGAAQTLAASGPGSGWLAGAIGDASTLASKLWDAATAAASVAQNRVVGSDGKVVYKDQLYANMRGRGVVPQNEYAVPAAAKVKRSGGGGGAGSIDPDSFNALTKAAEDALEKLENAVAGIHEKVRLGLMSTAEGTKAIASAKEQAANSLADLIPKLEKVADAAGPKAAAAVAKWRAEVKGLVGDLNEASAGLADKLSLNFEKGFADFLSGAKKGKAAMADFKNFVIQQLAAIAAQKFTASIITPFIDSLVGSITGGLSGGTPVETNALGGVYGGPGISAYSGTVVDRPTFFPFAKGVGLMGEAGEEAILPLDRDGSGRLGVRASGGGGGDVIVNISTPAGTKASSTERSEGNSRIIDVMIETVEGTIAGNIAQGRGPMADAMSNTYGLSRMGR